MPTRFRAEPRVVKVGKNARPGQSQLNPFRSTYARPSAGAKGALGLAGRVVRGTNLVLRSRAFSFEQTHVSRARASSSGDGRGQARENRRLLSVSTQQPYRKTVSFDGPKRKRPTLSERRAVLARAVLHTARSGFPGSVGLNPSLPRGVVMTKNIPSVVVGAAVVSVLTTGCATGAPQPLAADVNDMPTGSFQGSYTGHTDPPPALPVTGSFKGGYTGSSVPAKQYPVKTSEDPNVQNEP